MTNKLIKRLKRFLKNEEVASSEELKAIKRKLDKLKTQCRKLKVQIEDASGDERKQLKDQLAIAKAVRKKALEKYREMKK